MSFLPCSVCRVDSDGSLPCQCRSSGACGFPPKIIGEFFLTLQALVQLFVWPNKEFSRIIFSCFSLLNHHFFFSRITMLHTRHLRRGNDICQSLAIFLGTSRGSGVKLPLFLQFCGTGQNQPDDPFGLVVRTGAVLLSVLRGKLTSNSSIPYLLLDTGYPVESVVFVFCISMRLT